MIQKAAAMGNWWLAPSPRQWACSCIMSHAGFLVKHQITQVTQSLYSPDLVPSNFWLFPKLKSSMKGKRFQTINESQENMTGKLMAIVTTVWGLKVPTLKGTEASLSCVQCFLYLVSSSINVSIFSYCMAGYFLDRYFCVCVCVCVPNFALETFTIYICPRQVMFQWLSPFKIRTAIFNTSKNWVDT